MPAKPVRKKSALAQPLAPLPKKPQLLKIFRRFYQEISNLKPARFIYFPINYDNPFSLPSAVAKILYHQELLDIDGRPLYQNKRKLNDPIFKRHLETKLLLSLVDHHIHLNYYKHLAPISVEFTTDHLLRNWNTASHLVCQHLSQEASVHFAADFFSHHFFGHSLPQLPPLKPSNQHAKKAISKHIKKHLPDYQEIIKSFLDPLPRLKNKQKTAIINQTTSIISHQLPFIDPITQRFSLSIETQPFLNLNLHYPD